VIFSASATRDVIVGASSRVSPRIERELAALDELKQRRGDHRLERAPGLAARNSTVRLASEIIGPDVATAGAISRCAGRGLSPEDRFQLETRWARSNGAGIY
jgi:hypothetical protein